MISFTERLLHVQQRQDSLLCIGLDTDPALLPPHLERSESAVLDFNRALIEATHHLVCCYKINLAFYEAMGAEGYHTLKKTLESIPNHLITIGDGKRGDIGNTSARYADALFVQLGFDAATVNPYMGFDSVEPFLTKPDRGVFLLALTSNRGSKDFQHLKIGTKPLYERVVAAAKKWNSNENIGLVVGATQPRQMKRIRTVVPRMPLLIPGIGSQGGDLPSAVRNGCTQDGYGAIINVSRSVIYASRSTDYADAARQEALRLRNEIRTIQERYFT
ncbi:MAG: orotidine-5'-phosphate decarboxylase [Ignavibacteria bacterium]|nr:orotidine-5'-phosphate decarboxylase [Ignavibacteria bacterium]